MSTTIFSGYRLNSANLNKVQQVNESAKEFIYDLIKEHIYKLCVNSLIDYKLELIRKPDLSFWDYFEHCYDLDHKESLFVKNIFSDKLTIGSFFHQHLQMIEICSNYNLDFMLNFRATVFFKSYKNATYYIINGGPGMAYDLLSYNTDLSFIKDLNSYNYWTSTDKPDDITDRAWNLRGKNWDKIFKYKPELEMNQFVIIPLKMYLKKEAESNDMLFKIIPDDHELLVKFYKKSKKSIYWDEFLENGVKSSDISDLVGNKIKEDINTGVHLDYTQKAIDAGFTRSLIMDSLLNMKLSYPVI